MQNRIDMVFSRLRMANQTGLIAYIAAGDPDLRATEEIVLGLEKAGVDIIELGLPFFVIFVEADVADMVADAQALLMQLREK